MPDISDEETTRELHPYRSGQKGGVSGKDFSVKVYDSEDDIDPTEAAKLKQEADDELEEEVGPKVDSAPEPASSETSPRSTVLSVLGTPAPTPAAPASGTDSNENEAGSTPPSKETASPKSETSSPSSSSETSPGWNPPPALAKPPTSE